MQRSNDDGDEDDDEGGIGLYEAEAWRGTGGCALTNASNAPRILQMFYSWCAASRDAKAVYVKLMVK